MDGSRRIVLVGKTGSGKSHLANTIFGENVFAVDHSPNSGTISCQAETRFLHGVSTTLVDTPGFFDTERSEEELRPEIIRCLTECAPGPHAFLIVLRLGKFTRQEQDLVDKFCQFFSDEALRYAVVVFTHGDELPRGMTVEEFVAQNGKLSALVQRCGGRCHVFDNKHWNDEAQADHRSNRFQLQALLRTIDGMAAAVEEGQYENFYTNEVLQEVKNRIQNQMGLNPAGGLAQEEVRRQAQANVFNELMIQLVGTATGALLGAFFGLPPSVACLIQVLKSSHRPMAKSDAALAVAVGTGVVAGAAGVTGAIMGGVIGNKAARGAETPAEAAVMAANAVRECCNTLMERH